MKVQVNVEELLEHEGFVSGVSALGYGCASLAMVCLNHMVLDDWGFPSTTMILVCQVLATFCFCGAARIFLWRPVREAKRLEDFAKEAAPKMAFLFVLDVALGHVAARSLGLDAFANLRRSCIPIAAHLEPRALKRSPRVSYAVALACWSMLAGPSLAMALGPDRNRAFDATSLKGIFAAMASAAVVALRVVYLKKILIASSEISREEVAEKVRRRHSLPPEENALVTPTQDDDDLEDEEGVSSKKKKLVMSRDSSFALSFLFRTAAYSLPLIIAFGLFFEEPGLKKLLSDRIFFRNRSFLATYLALTALGPIHEVAVYCCVLTNSGLTTLIAGGFKSTALSTYRGLTRSEFAQVYDRWESLGIAVSTLASCVYTHAWWQEQQKRQQIRRELDKNGDDLAGITFRKHVHLDNKLHRRGSPKRSNTNSPNIHTQVSYEREEEEVQSDDDDEEELPLLLKTNEEKTPWCFRPQILQAAPGTVSRRYSREVAAPRGEEREPPQPARDEHDDAPSASPLGRHSRNPPRRAPPADPRELVARAVL